MAVSMTPSAALSDFGGRRYHLFVAFNFLLSLATPHLHGVLVLVTGYKFIVGVIVTGNNCSLVLLSPAINLSLVLLSPAIIVHFIAGINIQQHRRSQKICDKDYSPVSLTPENSLLPVLLTPVINIHSRITPQIFDKI
jgi:hypothetical protein